MAVLNCSHSVGCSAHFSSQGDKFGPCVGNHMHTCHQQWAHLKYIGRISPYQLRSSTVQCLAAEASWLQSTRSVATSSIATPMTWYAHRWADALRNVIVAGSKLHFQLDLADTATRIPNSAKHWGHASSSNELPGIQSTHWRRRLVHTETSWNK